MELSGILLSENQKNKLQPRTEPGSVDDDFDEIDLDEILKEIGYSEDQDDISKFTTSEFLETYRNILTRHILLNNEPSFDMANLINDELFNEFILSFDVVGLSSPYVNDLAEVKAIEYLEDLATLNLIEYEL
jgi:hypothetical protein